MTQTLVERCVNQTDSLEISTEIVNICTEAKGSDIAVLNVAKISDVCDYFIVISARSDRHAQGLSNRLIEHFNEQGIEPIAVEGLEKGHWVVLDYHDVIVHIFYEPLRSHYDIESLWARAPRLAFVKPKEGKQMELRAA